MISDKLVVEVAVGESRAVSRDKQICVVEIGSVYGNELYLTGPLLKLTCGCCASLSCRRSGGLALDCL